MDEGHPEPDEKERLQRGLVALTQLYSAEASLVQQKVGHILAIRSLAVTVFSGIVAATFLSPGKGVEFVSLTMLLFYPLDAVYDAYLIPIVDREEALRSGIASLLAKLGDDSKEVGSIFGKTISHRLAPTRWSPFMRGFFEPMRIAFYAVLTLAPIVAVHGGTLLRTVTGQGG